jgi:hypothetical protein
VRGDARWRACTGTKAGAGLTASPWLPKMSVLSPTSWHSCSSPVAVQPQLGARSALKMPRWRPSLPFNAPRRRQLRPAASAQHGCAGTHGEGCGPPHVREGVQCLPAVYRQSACARRQHTHTAGLAAGLLPALWHPPAWAPCAGWPSWAVAAPAAVIWAPEQGCSGGPLARGRRPRTAELARQPHPACRHPAAQLLLRRPGARFRRWSGDGSQTLAL